MKKCDIKRIVAEARNVTINCEWDSIEYEEEGTDLLDLDVDMINLY